MTWTDRAACKGHDPNLWHPEMGSKGLAAIKVCDTCPVITQCAAAGITEHLGVWGGHTARHRRRTRTAA